MTRIIFIIKDLDGKDIPNEFSKNICDTILDDLKLRQVTTSVIIDEKTYWKDGKRQT